MEDNLLGLLQNFVSVPTREYGGESGTPKLGFKFQIVSDDFVVTEVDSKSAAATAGLFAGDVITAVSQPGQGFIPLCSANASQFFSILQDNASVSLRICRNSREHDIQVVKSQSAGDGADQNPRLQAHDAAEASDALNRAHRQHQRDQAARAVHQHSPQSSPHTALSSAPTAPRGGPSPAAPHALSSAPIHPRPPATPANPSPAAAAAGRRADAAHYAAVLSSAPVLPPAAAVAAGRQYDYPPRPSPPFGPLSAAGGMLLSAGGHDQGVSWGLRAPLPAATSPQDASPPHQLRGLGGGSGGGGGRGGGDLALFEDELERIRGRHGFSPPNSAAAAGSAGGGSGGSGGRESPGFALRLQARAGPVYEIDVLVCVGIRLCACARVWMRVHAFVLAWAWACVSLGRVRVTL